MRDSDLERLRPNGKTPVNQELYAAGFNAHGQLNFNESTKLQDAEGSPDHDGAVPIRAGQLPRALRSTSFNDLRDFNFLVEGFDIKVVDASWSQTVGEHNEFQCHRDTRQHILI